MTKGEAVALMDSKLKNEFEAGVKRNLKVPVTQSMFDACVSMAYNMGVGGLT
jgi:GH24 family phage-related lysozyme (muramidase)